MTSSAFPKLVLLLVISLAPSVLATSPTKTTRQTTTSSIDTFAKKNNSREYQKVEAIIYLNNNYKDNSHQWISSPLPDIPKHAILLKNRETEHGNALDDIQNTTNTLNTGISTDDDSFTFLPENQFVLKNEKEKLEASTRYTVLQHFAWKQPADSGHRMQGLSAIKLLDNENLDYMIQGTIHIKHLQTINNLMISLSVQYCKVKDDEKHKKNIREYLESGLSQNSEAIDTLNTEPSRQETKVNNTSSETKQDSPGAVSRTYLSIERYFEIKETREIKNIEQLQYFDGPIFSVLLKITPYLNLR